MRRRNLQTLKDRMWPIGETFGNWRVICLLKKNVNGEGQWMVACSQCNHTRVLYTKTLRHGNTPCAFCREHSGRAA
jgi:hypothetical protein